MGWLIALAVIVLLAILPLGAGVIYDVDGLLVKIIAGPIRIQVLPRKKKGEKPKKAEKPRKKKAAPKSGTAKKEPEPEKKGGPITDFFPLVQLVFDFLGDFFRKIRVNRMDLKLTMAGDDPCDLAVNYGRTQAILAVVEPMLEHLFVIKKKNLQVHCDFEEDQTRIHLRLDITITLGRLIALAVRYGFRAVREYLKIMNLRKGGAVK